MLELEGRPQGARDKSEAQVEEELVKCGFNICMDKIRIQYVPTKEQLLEIDGIGEELLSRIKEQFTAG